LKPFNCALKIATVKTIQYYIITLGHHILVGLVHKAFKQRRQVRIFTSKALFCFSFYLVLYVSVLSYGDEEIRAKTLVSLVIKREILCRSA
jgi:hypothetical protein